LTQAFSFTHFSQAKFLFLASRIQVTDKKVSKIRRKHEYFHIRKWRRTYDRRRNSFTVNIAYETAARITPRSIAVAEAFGLGLDQRQKFVLYDDVELKISPQDICLITGDSGSGKSVLLKALRRDLSDEAADMTDVQVDPNKPLIETVGKTVEDGLELLSRVGLNDAFLFLRSYDQLSDGQKYRYRIAKLLESGKQWWFMDEFCATLDRDTAKIVAFNTQKIARSLNKAIIVATTHFDLFEDLRPSVHVHKRFGKEISVAYHTNERAEECSLVKEIQTTQGSMQEWKQLAPFHYRSHRISAPRKIFCLRRGQELCGVIVYCYPAPACYGRRLLLPRMNMSELNSRLSVISRVVIHPKYRTIGLGAKLIKETLPLAGTPNVEMLAVMAKYNPFAEKAGMKKVAIQPSSEEAVKIAAVLQTLGFQITMLSSSSYVLTKLGTLNQQDLEKIQQAFIKFRHVRFSKALSEKTPFGNKSTYTKKIKAADSTTTANLINICGLLLQTKAYLFWQLKKDEAQATRNRRRSSSARESSTQS
jgi:ABC-type lipoprotein export system ATPase subunit/GNAT superfamily N-acetyltransferase